MIRKITAKTTATLWCRNRLSAIRPGEIESMSPWDSSTSSAGTSSGMTRSGFGSRTLGSRSSDMVRSCSAQTDAGVEPGVRDVGEQVEDDQGDHDDDHP